jgi:hypothetical protein
MNIRFTLLGLASLLSLSAPLAASASGPSDSFLRQTSITSISLPVAFAKGRLVFVHRVSRRLLRQTVVQKRSPVRYAVPLAREIL